MNIGIGGVKPAYFYYIWKTKKGIKILQDIFLLECQVWEVYNAVELALED